jgi:hypothetical protein
MAGGFHPYSITHILVDRVTSGAPAVGFRVRVRVLGFKGVRV